MRWRFSVLTFVVVLVASASALAQPAHRTTGAHHGGAAPARPPAATHTQGAPPSATPPSPIGASGGTPGTPGAVGTAGAPSGAPVTPGADVDGGMPAAPMVTAPAVVPFEDGGTLTGEQYQVRLRDLEARVNELKEEIFRSKARLSLLAESVLQNVVGGSRAVITHQNEMGGAYRLVGLVYSLDGAPIVTRTDDTGTGTLGDQVNFQVYNGQVGSGDHTLGVNLEYVGSGLPYMKGYRFRVRSTQSFSVPEGKAIQIRVVGYEKGGPFEPPESRPAIRYVQRLMSLRDAADQNAEGSADGQGIGATNGSVGGAATQGASPAGGAGNGTP